jgi:hypothetical protein
MHRTEDGKPLEVLLNPLSMPSRVNNSLVYELLLGKIAAKTGKPYKLPGFNKKGEKWHEFVEQELAKNGIVDKERVYDPKLDKWLQNPITVGNAYILKLHHMGEAKLSARGQGGYTADRQPSKGGEAGGKRMSNLEVTGLLSSGATNILREGSVLRGDENTDYWMELRKGGNPKLKNNSFAWDKFRAMLTGAGFHTNLDDRTGNMRIGPVTDRILDQLKSKEIGSADTLDMKSLHPIKGGLFDDTLSFTNSWGHISLDHPVPNPAFEDSIRKLLNLKEADLRDIISGKRDLPPELVEKIQRKLKEKRASTVSFPTTGPEAISEALNALDMDELEAEANLNLKTSKKTLRTDAVRKLSVLKGLRRNGLTPSELMLKKVPVIPTRFRPFNVIGETIVLGDVNELYRDLINLRDTNRQIRDTFGDKAYNESKLQAYDAVKATFGFGDPTEVKTKQRGVSGLLEKITGKGGAKFSYPQRNLLSKTQDFTGRGVIVVDPELSMDEIAIPEAIAWTTFAPHVQRRMVRQGMSPANAVKMIKEQNDTAKRYLEEEMKEHPVMYSRAPAWHKFNSAGAYAKITEGHAIKVSPYITTSQNADFDGDQQISKVFILSDSQTLKNSNKNQEEVLTSQLPLYMVEDMIAKNIIPAFNTNEKSLSLVDLEDFPHGEFLGSNPNGANGPIDFYAPIAGTKVVALDETTMRPTWADVSFYSKHPQRVTEIVNLSRDLQIITDDDPRAVYGMSTNSDVELSRFTPTESLEQKVLVPRIKNLDLANTLGTIENITVTEDDEVPFSTLPATFDFGYVLGALTGDGWWNKKDYNFSFKGLSWPINLSDLSGAVAKELEAFFQKNMKGLVYKSKYIAKKEGDSRYGDTQLHTYFFEDSKLFSLFCAKYLGGQRDENTSGSGNKKLPDFLLFTPYEFRRGYLTGLIDTDGSCSIVEAEAKNKPQLQVQFSSTSLRLVRDVVLLAKSLSIGAKINFSRDTTAGNTAWVVNFSTVDLKNKNLLRDLKIDYKRQHFLTSDVDINSATAVAADIIPLPSKVFDILTKFVHYPYADEIETITMSDKQREENRLVLNMVTNFKKSKGRNYITRGAAKKILELLHAEEQQDRRNIAAAIHVLEASIKSGSFDKDIATIIRLGINTKSPAGSPSRDTGIKIQSRLNRCIKDGKISKQVATTLLEDFNALEYSPVLETPLVQKWIQIVENEDVTWHYVETVEKTGQKEDGHDLTVPGYETFMNFDGVILSNTMNIHVPSTPEAIDDVKNKIMPSKMLFNIKQHDSVAYPVTQEMILSLYSSQHKKGEPVSFATEQEAIRAIEAGNVPLSAEIQIGGMKSATVGEQEVEVENVTNSATFSDSNPKRLVSNAIKKTPLERAKSTKGNAGRHINWTKLTKKNFNGVTRKFD